MTPDEYRMVLEDRTRLAQIDADRARERVEAQQKEFAALAKAGEIEKAMNLYKQQQDEATAERNRQAEDRIAAARREAQQLKEASDRAQAIADNERRSIQARAEKWARDGEISRALASHNLLEGAAEDITALVRDHFVVDHNGDSLSVRTPAGQTPAEYIHDFLSRKPHYVRASNPGGGTAAGQQVQAAQTPAANMPAATGDPSTFNEWFLGAAASGKLTGIHAQPDAARVDMNKAMGLKAIKRS
jgi:hypothetical protein